MRLQDWKPANKVQGWVFLKCLPGRPFNKTFLGRIITKIVIWFVNL